MSSHDRDLWATVIMVIFVFTKKKISLAEFRAILFNLKRVATQNITHIVPRTPLDYKEVRQGDPSV